MKGGGGKNFEKRQMLFMDWTASIKIFYGQRKVPSKYMAHIQAPFEGPELRKEANESLIFCTK